MVDGEPDPWRQLARFGPHSRYVAYPFAQARDAQQDLHLENYEAGAMLLHDGRRVCARHSVTRALATLDPRLNRLMVLDRESFAEATGLLRGTVTHDGLPFLLPVEMQPLVQAVILTHWQMELDRPGDLSSYCVRTRHAAIGGFHFYQRVEPFHGQFMRLIHELARDPHFCTYPLATHLTDSWLGGNLCLSNQRSRSELEFDPALMRAYYHQQLDWQMGVLNLMQYTSFRTRAEGGRRVARSGAEMERDLDLAGLALHQMERLLRFDSHLFARPTRTVSRWPQLHPGFTELDQQLSTVSLPRL